MFPSLTQGGMNVTARSPILTQSAGAITIRRPTTDEVASAKRWVEERRRIAFNHSFDGVAGSPVPESDIPEYIRKLERLDMVLGNIERYIHIAFAALRREGVVRRMFNMMASTKCQLEECKKPNPRYVLELHTIEGMIQEADSMDKGLRTVLGLKPAAQGNSPMPQQPQQPTRTLADLGRFGGGLGLFREMNSAPAPPAAPPVIDKRNGFKRSSWSDNVDTDTATGSKHLAGCQSVPVSQTRPRRHPSPPKVKAAAKSKAPVAPVKRAREDGGDGTTQGCCICAISEDGSDWVDPPNGEARKRDEQAENVKTGEQALTFLKPSYNQGTYNCWTKYLLSLPMSRHNHTNPERGHLLGGFAHLSADEGDKSGYLSGNDSEDLDEGGLPQTSVEEVEEGSGSKRARLSDMGYNTTGNRSLYGGAGCAKDRSSNGLRHLKNPHSNESTFTGLVLIHGLGSTRFTVLRRRFTLSLTPFGAAKPRLVPSQILSCPAPRLEPPSAPRPRAHPRSPPAHQPEPPVHVTNGPCGCEPLAVESMVRAPQSAWAHGGSFVNFYRGLDSWMHRSLNKGRPPSVHCLGNRYGHDINPGNPAATESLGGMRGGIAHSGVKPLGIRGVNEGVNAVAGLVLSDRLTETFDSYNKTLASSIGGAPATWDRSIEVIHVEVYASVISPHRCSWENGIEMEGPRGRDSKDEQACDISSGILTKYYYHHCHGCLSEHNATGETNGGVLCGKSHTKNGLKG
ncbi:hypothetical protein EDB86DRAFT_2837494 [Lactarius hatsudake]|nr:hypothetical protein EDB86DRAFT_2837494 [Lactarius hatsudake]